ncbi:hypothetical protein D5S17_27325 [Pseudonocardiaceae bacterium YIM PH 21723]|nr:hypothetical protein D5S17_27325 [Pseudonocardiaceae bacterium YIM PH 21723]
MANFVDPTTDLSDPKAEEPIPNIADKIMSISDYVSPGHWLLEACGLICGGNPAEQLGELIAGDWEGLAKSADGLSHLKKFDASLNKQVQAIKANMQTTWTGNASNAAAAYFAKLEAPLAKHGAVLSTLSNQYHTAAYAVWGAGKAITSILEMLADILIDLALDLLASAITVETGVGPVIGAVLAGYLVWKANQVWLKALEWWGRCNTAVHALVSPMAGFIGTMHEIKAVPLPAGAYDNPQV